MTPLVNLTVLLAFSLVFMLEDGFVEAMPDCIFHGRVYMQGDQWVQAGHCYQCFDNGHGHTVMVIDCATLHHQTTSQGSSHTSDVDGGLIRCGDVSDCGYNVTHFCSQRQSDTQCVGGVCQCHPHEPHRNQYHECLTYHDCHQVGQQCSRLYQHSMCWQGLCQCFPLGSNGNGYGCSRTSDCRGLSDTCEGYGGQPYCHNSHCQCVPTDDSHTTAHPVHSTVPPGTSGSTSKVLDPGAQVHCHTYRTCEEQGVAAFCRSHHQETECVAGLCQCKLIHVMMVHPECHFHEGCDYIQDSCERLFQEAACFHGLCQCKPKGEFIHGSQSFMTCGQMWSCDHYNICNDYDEVPFCHNGECRCLPKDLVSGSSHSHSTLAPSTSPTLQSAHSSTSVPPPPSTTTLPPAPGRSPKVSVTDDKTVALGSFVSMGCRAEGDPPPSLTWKKVNTQSYVTEAVDPSLVDSFGQTLTILHVTEKDEGTYMCEARNSLGFDSNATRLFIQKEAPTITEISANQEASLGSNVTLTCKARGFPLPQIQWHFVQPDGTVTALTSQGDAIVLTLHSSDAGSYRCDASNALGTVSATVNVTVHEEAPVIKDISPPTKLSPGDNATLYCNVTGVPPPLISWRFVSNAVHAIVVGSGPTYDVTNMEASKEGVYVCHAVNTQGVTSADVIVELRDVPPKILSAPGQMSVHSTENLTLTCDATGNPSPIVSWEQIDASGARTFVSNGNVLFIPHMDSSHVGSYVCTARNRAGNDSVTFKLTLHEEPPVIRNMSSAVVLPPGGNATLHCDVTGIPTPTVTWKLLKSDGHVTVVGAGPTYDVTNMTAEKAGLYLCHAANSVGVTSSDVTVEYRLEKPVISGVPSAVQIPFATNRTLNCSATGFPAPVFTWTFISNNGATHVLGSGPHYDVINMSADKEGYYMCTAKNMAGTISAMITVKKQDVPPTITQAPVDVTAKKGDNVTLTCKAEGHPEPTIAWGLFDLNGFPQSLHEVPGAAVDADGTVHVTSLSNQNAGRYICRAVSSAGRVSAMANVTIVT